MDSTTTNTAAVAAIVQYAREVARLPPFPTGPWPQALVQDEVEQPTTVLKSIATDKVPGEVLPRATDTWLALLPFDDLTKQVSDTSKRDLIRKRRAFVEILATVARSSRFPWDASTSMHRGEDSGSSTNTFWIDLMRELDPESGSDTTNEMARSLIAMSHTQSLRFLLSVAHDVVPPDFPEMLEQMLEPLATDGSTNSCIDPVLAACGVTNRSVGHATIELALSFSTAKLSPTLLANVLDVIDRYSHRRAVAPSGVELRVTSLRFGRNCVLQAKTIEGLGQRKSLSSITDLRLGDLHGAKPASLRLGINGVMSPFSGLRRLAATSLNAFQAVASTLRSRVACVEELDVAFKPTTENAAWLAFALFHLDSKSRVSSLRLRVPPSKHTSQFGHTQTGLLNDEWLTAFKRALRSTTADVDLASLEGGEERDDCGALRRMVTLTVGTPVKAEPYSSARLQCKIDDETEPFEAIATISNSLAVIVPGLGVGWVPTASVTSEKLLASRLSPGSDVYQTNQSITSLAWDCALPLFNNRPIGNHVKVLLEILEIVGRPLERLHLPALKLTTKELARVLTCCPNLVELNISGHAMTSISPLVDAYTSGSCKIASLSIVRPSIQRGMLQESIPEEMVAILRARGGATLRRLAVHVAPLLFAPPASVAQHKESILTLVRTLGSSNALEYLQLPGSALWASTQFTSVGQVHERGLGESATPQGIAVNVSTHPFCISKMPLGHKLAFLSCLEHQDESSAWRRVDACILGLIFRFSGRRIARQVIPDAPSVTHGFGAYAFLTATGL